MRTKDLQNTATLNEKFAFFTFGVHYVTTKMLSPILRKNKLAGLPLVYIHMQECQCARRTQVTQ